jgi:hypothetical protein
MPYTADNIEISIASGTAVIATDYGTSGAVGFSASHAQISKLAWGDENNTYRVSESAPAPVRIYGITGTTIPVSGTVSGTGYFFVKTNDAFPIKVIGSTFSTDPRVGITGTIQGIANGVPVGVTGNVNVNNNIGIFGISGATAIGITGGRRLSSTTDSVYVYGNVGISGGFQLTAIDDSVSVYGPAGSTFVEINLNSGGSALGRSGDALKVAVTNTGFTFSVSLATTIGVTNDVAGNGLRIQGTTSGTPVTIQGSLAGGAVEIGAYSAVPVGVSGSVTIDDTDLISSIEDLKTNIDTVATNASYALDILNLVNASGAGAKVNIASTTRPTTFQHGQKALTVTPSVLGSSQLRTGVTLKSPITNTVDIYVGNSLATATTTNGYILSPGEIIFLEIGTLGSVFVRTASGTANLTYIGS